MVTAFAASHESVSFGKSGKTGVGHPKIRNHDIRPLKLSISKPYNSIVVGIVHWCSLKFRIMMMLDCAPGSFSNNQALRSLSNLQPCTSPKPKAWSTKKEGRIEGLWLSRSKHNKALSGGRLHSASAIGAFRVCI